MSDSDSEHYGMEYMERIDAYIDSGITDLIDFFLDRGYETEFCCSGLFEDHYTQDELDSFPEIREGDPYRYDFDVLRPYIAFDSIFHDLEEEVATVDDTVYYLKEALSGQINVVFYSGDPSETTFDSHEKISLNFDIGTPYQGNPAADHTYILDIDKLYLQKCFEAIGKDISFYDELLQFVFRIVMLSVDEPILGHNISIQVDKENKSLKACATVRYLPENINREELRIEDNTDVEESDNGIGETLPRYGVYGELDDIVRELYEKPDKSYFESLYIDSKYDMDPFDHPVSPD